MPVSKQKNTGRKKTGTGKSTNNKKNTKSKKSPARLTAQEESFLRSEIFTLAALGVGILLMLSCFGVGGYVGEFVGSVLFGIFGITAYIVPVLIFIGTAFYMSNRGNLIAILKIIAGVAALLLICSLIQLIGADQAEAELVGFYTYAAQKNISGGWIGGILVSLMHPAFGMAGELLVTIILLIICAVIITEHSFVSDMKKGGRKVADKAKEDAARRREMAQIRQVEREQEKQLRMDRKASGVSKNTEITPEEDKSSGAAIAKTAKTAAAAVVNGAAAMQVRQEVPAKSADISNDSDFPRGKDPFTITGIHVEDNGVPEMPPFPDDAFGWEAQQQSLPLEPTPHIVADRPEDVLSDEAVRARQTEAHKAEEPVIVKKSSKKISPEEEVTAEDIEKEMEANQPAPFKEYVFPPIELLKRGKNTGGMTDFHLRDIAEKLTSTLRSFGVNVKVTNVSCGPAVTRYELQPEQGVKVSKIVSLADDIKLNLAAADIRIEAPIPGKAAVGIEVPNKENSAVMLRDLLESKDFQNHKSKIAFAAGKDIGGQVVVTDIAKMPHLLIAGATGSGKSVCINTIIMSILYKAKPDEVKLIMIDPKVVELSVYNGIPHLYIPVVTDPKKASGALQWAVAEMMDRYEKFAEANVRDLTGYNAKVDSLKEVVKDTKITKLPQIVIVVDELADLMMVAPGEVEESICRLAQLARAAGIHLILATQRPSVNVITGLIKANMPSRIAFSVSSGVDSRTILDMVGAEKLLGKGDMLFYPQGYTKPARVQGAFVSDEEVGAVVEFLTTENSMATYNKDIETKMNAIHDTAAASGSSGGSTGGGGPERDSYFVEAGKFIIEKDKASIGMLQRWFKIGFNRAARIMDQLADAGVVGEEEGTKPRKVLMSMEEFEQYIDEYV